ncbi:MAG TPA: Ku protein [Mycobacteriales bacterium]|nr:Ku protein [Mycobacteriales bacterium]
MRSIWKGAISFGLVTIPVKLYSATDVKDVSFHQVHRADGGRIRFKRVCSIDGEEVPFSDIAKGYELGTGEVVMLGDEDFADLPLRTSRSIDVLTFVPLDQVDPMYFERSYYLEPETAGTKPYVLLREALEQSGRVALVKVALRQRETLAALRVRDGVFVLETMLWPDEIRTPDFAFLDEEVPVRPQELAMAVSLIETLAGDFDPMAYTDDYRSALQELIEAKIAGRDVVAPAEPTQTGGAVVDLMAALRASVEAARGGRSDASPAPSQPASAPGTASKRGKAKTAAAPRGARATPATAGESPRKAAPTRKVSAKKTAKRTSTRRSA